MSAATMETIRVHKFGGPGVGHIAAQLSKWREAHVIAVASSQQASFVRELGADEFIDYTKIPPEDVARDIDLVLTAVRFLRTLKRGCALFRCS